MRRFVGYVCVIAASTCCVTPAAFAQDPDVIVDPDSPSAKEYAIPLQAARQQATGEKIARVPQAEAKIPAAPLFGVGIPVKRPKAQAPSPAPDRGKRSRERPEVSVPAPPSPDIRALAAPPETEVADLVLLGGGGAAFLLAGTLAGIALRRRRSGV